MERGSRTHGSQRDARAPARETPPAAASVRPRRRVGVRVLLTLEYDGTDFAGWQRQAPGTRSVQAVVEAALAALFEQPISLLGASRTDAGVHAEGQAAAFSLPREFPPGALVRALNARLPEDVAVRAAEAVPDAFHPIRDALEKHYRYAIWNARERSPLRARRSAHVPVPLDLEAMREAAGSLVGRRDFASFQTGALEWQAEAADTPRSTVRTIFACEVSGAPGAEIALDVRGDGFLRGMVRAIAGTLIETGQGRRPPAEMISILAARDRAAAGRAAPAAGLLLRSVRYPGAEKPAATGR